jgi:diguanylate cyclase (GGDEF)-like protein/PAS domain S-box-containing protein
VVEAIPEVKLDEESLLLLRAVLESEIDPRTTMTALRDASGVIVDFVYREVNPAACDYIGRPRDRLVGARLLDVFPGDYASGLLDSYRSVVETGEPLVLNDFCYDGNGPDSIGQWFDIRATRIGDGLSSTWREVTDRHRAAVAAAQSEEHYRVLAENSSDFVLLVDLDGVMSWSSPSVSRELGWPLEQVVGLRTLEFIHPDDLSAALDVQSRANAGGVATARLRVRDASGTYRWFVSTSRPVHSQDGTTVGRVVSFRDVDSEVVAEEALAESERMYRLLAENSSDFVTLADPEGLLQWASPSATRILGWQPEDKLGAPTTSFLHPADVAKLLLLRTQMAANQTSGLRARIADAAGAYHWFDMTIKPVFDESGTLIARVTAYRDVQSQVAIEEALASSEAQFRMIAENSTDVIVYAQHGTMVWVSPSLTEELGWEPVDWVGKPILAFVHPDDSDAMTAVRDILDLTVPVRTRFRLQSVAGTYHWVEAHARRHVGESGEPDGWISAFRIIDDMVRAEKELDRRARFDALTGLLNRKEILHEIAEVAQRTHRTGIDTAVLFCDIDLFKDINDRLGHAAGDEVLRVLAERLTSSIRRDDHAARIGGDEMLVLLAGVHNLAEATEIAEKIRRIAANPIDLLTGVVSTTLSIGVTLSRPGERTDDLIARADAAMYEAKATGRNQVVAI